MTSIVFIACITTHIATTIHHIHIHIHVHIHIHILCLHHLSSTIIGIHRIHVAVHIAVILAIRWHLIRSSCSVSSPSATTSMSSSSTMSSSASRRPSASHSASSSSVSSTSHICVSRCHRIIVDIAIVAWIVVVILLVLLHIAIIVCIQLLWIEWLRKSRKRLSGRSQVRHHHELVHLSELLRCIGIIRIDRRQYRRQIHVGQIERGWIEIL
mmetsp:Transcript_3883/g.6520  ORF Transcript_3883/g.6520 Transcript_3883/m.6520 type:complete len:212 (+) Transcript_3883:166-801(+)